MTRILGVDGEVLKPDQALYHIRKTDDDQRLVYGWASIIKRGGLHQLDFQNDVILETELHKAAHGYMLTGRGGKVAHEGEHIADPVESMLITKNSSFGALLDSLGMQMPDPLPLEGWWTGFKVVSDPVWKSVKDGTLKSFSIGGTGQRVPLDLD